MNKEAIYDREIYPLMDQIVAICRAHGIAVIARFAIPNDDDPNLCCTTCLPDGEGSFPYRIRMANEPQAIALTITRKGADDAP